MSEGEKGQGAAARCQPTWGLTGHKVFFRRLPASAFHVSTGPAPREVGGRSPVPNQGSKHRIFFSKSGVISKNTSSLNCQL